MTKSISFLHAADLHLDTAFKGLSKLPSAIRQEIRESTLQAFDRLIEHALKKDVDFILLVGDIFDEATQSLKTQMHLRASFQQLARANIDVFLSYGNHDYLEGNAFALQYPSNVHVFPSEQVTSFVFEKNDAQLAAIYGFSYETRAVTQNKITEYQVQNEQIPFHIATLHGSIYGDKTHTSYAPFQLQELLETPFDYWALGHIHQREILHKNPYIIYPGNIQGRHRNETGLRGCYYVTMDQAITTPSFIPLQSIQFENVVIDLSACTQIDEIEREMEKVLATYKAKTMIHLTIRSHNEEVMKMEQEGVLLELIDIMNDAMLNTSPWKYIYTYRFYYEVKQQVHSSFFTEDVLQELTAINVKETVQELYYTAQNRKFLEALDEASIKEKAQQLLLYGLQKK